MRKLVSGLLLAIAILAGILWLTATVASGIAKIIVLVFLALFVLSLFFKGSRSTKT